MLKAYHTRGRTEAGCDEAGRGCLAGPVTAAAVILPPRFRNKLLNDSKQLTARRRDKLRGIIEKKALAWAVAHVWQHEIDEINILNASFLAMHRALDQLGSTPDHILVDGNRFNTYEDIDHTCIIKGDGKYLSIAAASVLAKTHRDEYMQQQAEQHPQYSWNTNVGYPTKAHRQAIKEFGITPLHRKSFQLLPAQLELFENA